MPSLTARNRKVPDVHIIKMHAETRILGEFFQDVNINVVLSFLNYRTFHHKCFERELARIKYYPPKLMLTNSTSRS